MYLKSIKAVMYSNLIKAVFTLTLFFIWISIEIISSYLLADIIFYWLTYFDNYLTEHVTKQMVTFKIVFIYWDSCFMPVPCSVLFHSCPYVITILLLLLFDYYLMHDIYCIVCKVFWILDSPKVR
jgi:hypothetical protein